MEKRLVIGICMALVLTLNLTSCKKDNEETLKNNQGSPATCDTANMKYSANILPIIQSNCYSCHGNGQLEGGITLDGYNNLKIQVNNNSLINVITHASGYPAMPLGLPKLPECDINKIRDWINRGAPDN